MFLVTTSYNLQNFRCLLTVWNWYFVLVVAYFEGDSAAQKLDVVRHNTFDSLRDRRIVESNMTMTRASISTLMEGVITTR